MSLVLSGTTLLPLLGLFLVFLPVDLDVLDEAVELFGQLVHLIFALASHRIELLVEVIAHLNKLL